MFKLALQSFRYRTASFAASFVALFLGATIVMAFASMLDTSATSEATSSDQETLVNMASIVGGFGLIIVVFAVVSTLTLSVRQRSTEMAVLRNVGATPAQIGRMIVGEAVIVALTGYALAILPALLGGRLLFEVLTSTDQVSEAVPYRFGPVALSVGFGINLLATIGAAAFTARSTTRDPASAAMRATTLEPGRIGRKRVIVAMVFLALGINLAVVTATVFHGEGADAMQTAGQASIWASIGFALLAPAIVRSVTNAVAWPLDRMAGSTGHLALTNLHQRSRQMASVTMPIILFTGIATGTLYMQNIENRAASAEGIVKSNEQQNIETLNYVVVGIIVLFAAIMLVNTLIAATTYRGQEFGQQRLIGSTPAQVHTMVIIEATVLATTGVIFGSIASLATVVPYSIARTSTPVPDAPIAIFLATIATAFAIALAVSFATTRRVIHRPAIEAVTA